MQKNSNNLEEYNEITPEIMFSRIRNLEEELEQGKLTKDTMNELFDLYTVASEFYQENKMTCEFTTILKKMKEFFLHEKIQHLLKVSQFPHSKSVVGSLPVSNKLRLECSDKQRISVPQLQLLQLQSPNLTGENLKKKETFRKRVIATKRDLGVEAKDLISSFSRIANDEIKKDELNSQKLSFKQRLVDKKKSLETSGRIKDKNDSLDQYLALTSRRLLSDKLASKKDVVFTERNTSKSKFENIEAYVPIVELDLNVSSTPLKTEVKGKSKKKVPAIEIPSPTTKKSETTVSGSGSSSVSGLSYHEKQNSKVSVSPNTTNTIISSSSSSNSSTHITHIKSSVVNSSYNNSHLHTNSQNTAKSNNASGFIHHSNKSKTTKSLFNTHKIDLKLGTISIAAEKIKKEKEESKEEFTLSKKKAQVSQGSIFVPISKSASNKNMNLLSTEIFYDKERNSIRISQKKLIEIQSNLLSSNLASKEEDFIESFLKSNEVARILEHEFNLFVNKILSSKLQWMTKFQEDLEQLLVDYPKILNDKLKEINQKYEEDLKELEKTINYNNPLDINKKIYENLLEDKKAELNELNSLAKVKVQDTIQNSSELFNEKGLIELIDVHKTNILHGIKEKFLKLSDRDAYSLNSIERYEGL